FPFHQRQELVVSEIRGCEIDQLGRRINDVTRREDHLSAVPCNNLHLFSGFWMNSLCVVFVPFYEVVRLDEFQIFQGRCVFVDDYVVNHLKCGEICRSQLLRYVGPVLSFVDVFVRSETCNQEVSLSLCVQQMTKVAWVHHVKCSMAHNDLCL